VSLSLLELSIVLPPFVAGLLIVSMHVPLGREVLHRGIVFIDLAVAQIAALGVTFATNMGWDAAGWQTQAIAVGSALLGALLLRMFEHYWESFQEALIGVTFVMAATGGLLLLSGNQHGAEHMKDLLAGQLLWVSWEQIGFVALLYAAIAMLWFLTKAKGLWFYVLFALTVTASVQLIGVYLVFASLIVPALAVRGLKHPTGVAIGYLIGVFGYASGLLLSLAFDLPAGPTVVWTLALCAVVTGTMLKGRAEKLSARTCAHAQQ
jgi:zinc/manganese transport system permease protein